MQRGDGHSAERTPCNLPDCAAVDAAASLASCLGSAERVSIRSAPTFHFGRRLFMQNQPVSYVIIGNGIAGVTAAEILHNEDSSADITVIADDPFPVYYRPALKDYLAGRVREDKLWARPNSFYQDHNIRFLSDRVVGIQAGQHTVQVQSGREVTYDRLLLANVARASRLNCPGTNLIGVTTLRTVAD